MDNNKNKDDLFEALHRHLHNLVNKHKTLDRLPRNFGIAALLIGSEVHTIDVIGDCSIANVTEVGQRMGISKAAASQAVRKLHKNGYIRKLKDENNKREVYLSLTDKGRKVYQGHKDLWGKNCSIYLSDLTNEEIESFIKVAEKIILTVDAQLDVNP